MLTRLFARHPTVPATRPNAAVDWPFPFPAPGRTRPAAPDAVPAGIAYRWPFRPLHTPPLPNRGVPAPVSIAPFTQQATEWCDDVLSGNFLHRRFGAYCLIDTVVTNLEWPAYDVQIDWNPCVECNLCVASCPTDAIKPEGDFDFFACYNHTYRDSIPGFLDLVRDLSERSRRAFKQRWSDNEIAALWQAMAFKVEDRCFNFVATCPAEIEDGFHAERDLRRRYLDETLKPLTHTRAVEDEQFVIDSPSMRERHGIPPGEWRTPIDRRSRSAAGV